jgi:hypothetical protein
MSAALSWRVQRPLRVARPEAPYPGLRPFNTDEWTTFFGRERMTNDVIDQLVNKQFVVVHGDSGCGKSSMIRAGVLAQLELEHSEGGLSWHTSEMRPGSAPIDRFARALADLAPERSTELLDEVHNLLYLGRGAAPELARLLRHDSRTNLCILVDQFEELFSFARKHGRDEAQLFVAPSSWGCAPGSRG